MLFLLFDEVLASWK